ncbi:Adenylyl-sulfate kinase [Methylobacterium sp. 4-46]|uniref:adenylyl-sulfate kinase n=1 Tax=unclassified Methylobacterium TaxID=2615210 RepID=UPI000152CF03|nr:MULTISPECIES: adenylyl-sulfate kinase [Methylobacterium]ACA14819.1 Adenylyl-sulfate kinase [Methylobacterium sp. 4-46]WFT80564.1 adenylyl-sulfate kinase [Methylobacterium nodulans]
MVRVPTPHAAQDSSPVGEALPAGAGSRACIVWLTGLSGAGKSTLAGQLRDLLRAEGRPTTILDGDALRRGLNRDLGFSDADRVENIRRTAEVAWLMADAGLTVIVALISPFRRERAEARALARGLPFFEVHVDASLPACERRDPKGLYRRARAGEIPRFTGIDSAYEPPESPDLRVDTERLTPREATAQVLALLRG